MSYKCVGCDLSIEWNGTGMFSYTCPCGAHMFYEEETGRVSLPVSLVRGITVGGSLPHLDYLVGGSDHTSLLKEELIGELQAKGAIWMEECEQCQKDGTLQGKLEREGYLTVLAVEEMLRGAKGV